MESLRLKRSHQFVRAEKGEGQGGRKWFQRMGSMLLGVLLFVGLGFSQQAPPLRWEQLPTDGSDSLQFLSAGPKGEFQVFRVEPAQVLRMNRDGDGRLLPAVSFRENLVPRDVVRAVANGRGDVWFLLLRSKELLLLEANGRTKSLASPDWSVSAIGWMGGSPVVATMPFPRTDNAATSRVRPAKEDLPLILRYDGSKWETLLSEAYEVGDPPLSGLGQEMTRRQVLLAEASQGRLWVVNRNAYRIRLLSPGGRVLLDVDLGSEGLRPPKKPEELEAVRAKFMKEGPGARLGKEANVLVVDLSPVITGATEGPDGRLYLLTAPGVFGPERALDRFDPSSMELQRLRTLLGDEPATAFSIVATTNGLYAGGIRETLGGRWRLSWEVLEGAPWQRVKCFDPSGEAEDPKKLCH